MIGKVRSKRARGQLVEHVAELMADLGDHPFLVAQNLAKSSVTGIRAEPKDCAISSYLWAVIGGEPSVRSIDVRGGGVAIELSGWRRWVRVDFPPAICAFIVAFDANRFPGLVREDYRQHDHPSRTTGVYGISGSLAPGSSQEKH